MDTSLFRLAMLFALVSWLSCELVAAQQLEKSSVKPERIIARRSVTERSEQASQQGEPVDSQGEQDSGIKDVFQQEFRRIFGPASTIEMTAFDYLQKLVAGESDEAEYLDQIALLGSDDYQQRQNAEAYLFTVPILPEKFRDEINNHSDMEIRYRLKSIFAHRKTRVEDLLLAALQSIAAQKTRRALPTIFRLLEHTDSATARRAAFKTIDAIVDTTHRDLLIEQLGSKQSEVRLVCAQAYVRLQLPNPIGKLESLLDDEEERVRLEVSKLLVDLNHKPVVETLIGMLSSPSVTIATRAERVLRAITGEKGFGRISYADKKNNARVAEAWMKWKSDHLANVQLNLPLKDFLKSESRLDGHTLIAKDQSLIVELDENNDEVFRMTAKGVLSAEKTIEGNYLLFSYSGRWLKEYTPDKEVAWEISGPSFNNAMPLDNGNVLVSVGPKSIVQEIDPKTKKTVWEYKTGWWPNDAYRLENGNTLIGGKGGVVEVSPENKVVWEYKNSEASTIVVAKPTVNDGILIGWTNGLAREIDRDQKPVWEYKASELSDVFRDANGHTLIATAKEIIELSPDKKIVWRFAKQSKTASVRR